MCQKRGVTSVKTSEGCGGGAAARRGCTYYSAGLWDRCSRLRAPAPPPSGSSRLAAWASRSHAPATPRTGAPGWEEARPPPPAGESLGTLGHPGFSPHHWPPSRAESSDPAGRRPPPSQAALCTLPSALCLRPSPCLPRSCSLPDSPDAAPARRALPLRASARSRIRASEADRCSPGSDPGSPLLGRGSRTRTHTVQFQAGTGSRALSARCCEATPQPLKRKREGDRERAGGGGGREEGWGDGEGGRAREFPPPPRSQVPLGINSWKPLLERKELRFLGGGSGWRWSEWMDRIEERGGFCPLPLPRYEVTTEALHSLE